MLKDSFIFWYAKKPAQNVLFDRKPLGALPLGGCNVFPLGVEGEYFLFQITNVEFGKASLELRTKDKGDVEDWIRVLEDCKKATFENSLLGVALTEKLKSAGSVSVCCDTQSICIYYEHVFFLPNWMTL